MIVATAFAAERSLDIELLRPRYVDGAIPGVDALGDGERGEMHAGAFVHYTHDPLLLLGSSATVQGIERNRVTVDVGGAAQITRALAFRASFPIITDWETQTPDLGAPGVGFGDLWLGAVVGFSAGPTRLGAAIDLALPIGTHDAWRGEVATRIAPAVLADLHLGRFSLAASGTLQARGVVDTGAGLTVGNEVLADAGVGWDVWRDRARVTVSFLSRTGLDSAGRGSDAHELLAGVQVRPGRTTRVDAWVGRGLSLGYGAPDYRAGVGFTVHARRAPDVREPPPAVVVEAELPPQIVVRPLEDEPEVPPEPPPEPPALARVEADRITIRDPIQFALGTDEILPESQPTLTTIAGLLRDHPEILEVVIEGHASEEGSFLYNYDLSMRRSSAIFKALVAAGVHPTRLACRSMGEVAPATAGTAEAELARSRRVVFHITKRWSPGDPVPEYARDIRLPWTGEAATIPESPPFPEPPPEPPPPPPKPKEIPDESTFEEEDE